MGCVYVDFETRFEWVEMGRVGGMEFFFIIGMRCFLDGDA